MQFSTLIKINSLVKSRNMQRYGDKLELWFPHMFRDGAWSCIIVFDPVPDYKDIMPFVDLLMGEGVYWWVTSMNGDIAISVQ